MDPKLDEAPSIKVMSYNMRIASPPSSNWGGTDLAAIADVINRNKPDIVALQEVDVYTKRSGLDSNQAMELGKLTNMEYFFAKAVDRSEGDYGVAILSRFPIKESKAYRLPVSPGSDGEIRGLALIIVEVNNMDVVFMSTHFDHLSDKNRLLQTEKMMEVLSLHKDYPVIVGADFNMEPDNKVMDEIRNEMTGCTFCPLTFPQINPNTTIDYIMVNDMATKSLKLLNYYTVKEDYASDHLPLIGEFIFEE
ncbi:endonuclease/exonuclease/phosphatase family protein [Arenibacter sp. H213]|uniref:Endonuclease/exonuclease/phosphatase family protein n=2 Tax=Arenibacter antarcticus TaxID=2040469 RepID=A0ABW5VGG9_9FLAO|nr:endonuclease/exonuclease/phosphatase family protein [Arenibacter sp. H213]